jgi:hypothetical protein
MRKDRYARWRRSCAGRPPQSRTVRTSSVRVCAVRLGNWQIRPAPEVARLTARQRWRQGVAWHGMACRRASPVTPSVPLAPSSPCILWSGGWARDGGVVAGQWPMANGQAGDEGPLRRMLAAARGARCRRCASEQPVGRTKGECRKTNQRIK